MRKLVLVFVVLAIAGCRSYQGTGNNARYVQAWNEKVGQQSLYNSAFYPFESRIDYNPSIDYGLELNYQLYHYFQYIEDTYGNRYNFPH